MDTTTHHDIAALFAQLGLPNSPLEIQKFIVVNGCLPMNLDLPEAPFWTASQMSFLTEEWHADNGDWAILIDQLNACLRAHPKPHELGICLGRRAADRALGGVWSAGAPRRIGVD